MKWFWIAIFAITIPFFLFGKWKIYCLRGADIKNRIEEKSVANNMLRLVKAVAMIITINTLKCTVCFGVFISFYFIILMSRRNINAELLGTKVWNDYCRWGIRNELKHKYCPLDLHNFDSVDRIKRTAPNVFIALERKV